MQHRFRGWCGSDGCLGTRSWGPFSRPKRLIVAGTAAGNGARRQAVSWVLVNTAQAINAESTLQEVQAGAQAIGLQIRVLSRDLLKGFWPVKGS
jgi:hypothetical protein